MSILLRLDGVEAGYGDLTAVSGVTLEVRRGETVALIGSNGAGKTTTLRAISGLLPLRRGSIELEGRRLEGLRPAEIVARGIAHVPEGILTLQTLLTSLLLLADAPEYPIFRQTHLQKGFKLTQYPERQFPSDGDAAAWYAHALRFLDRILEEAQVFWEVIAEEHGHGFAPK